MINIVIYRNKEENIYGFKAFNHGKSIVCAAVSALTINTVNSIEALTDEIFTCDYNEEGGFLEFILPEIKDGKKCDKVDILLNSLLLGLKGIDNDNKGQLIIEESL